MTKIKVAGAFVFAFSIILAVLFGYSGKQSKLNNDLLNTINMQKSFTQEISKNIFYIYKEKSISYNQLNVSIKEFIDHMNYKNDKFGDISCKKIDEQNEKIARLWNDFYLSVQNFRDQSRVTSAYSKILIEQTVKNIYNKNQALISEFDKLIELHKSYFSSKLNIYKNIQYALFLLLLILLVYLFTQIKDVITFIQKFLHTSKNIITKSSIKDLEHITIHNSASDISEAADNFNLLVDKINTSIEYSANSIENSYSSVESVEKNIEDLLELLSVMDESVEIDKELTKKEDALIEALEELTSCAQKLEDVKTNLSNLISHRHKNKS